MRKSLIQPSVTSPNLAGKKRRKTTVGSIVVPKLPGYWPGRDGPDTRAMDLLREDDPPLTQDARELLDRLIRGETYVDASGKRIDPTEITPDCACTCPSCGHESGSLDYCDQVDCDCVDSFHCI